MTNSVEHARCHSVRITVSRPTPARVRVAVVDKSRTRPAPRTASATDTDGRGLVVVEVLSERWGTDLLRGGKRVWAELHTKAGQ